MCLLLAGLSTLPMVSFKGFAFWTALCGVPYSVVFVFIGHAASDLAAAQTGSAFPG
jgi:hypothetical protein